MDAVTPQDVLIVVAGVTGSGKSSFIQSLVADAEVEVGHDLLSCTGTVGFFPLRHATGRRVFLVDTPGFDDTYKSDGEILQAIAFVLAQTYRQQLPLAGVVYLHPITMNRFGGTAARNLDILKKLCGENAYSRITLLSSMWDVLDGDPKRLVEAVEREATMSVTDVAWGPLCEHGAEVMFWKRGNPEASSMAVIDRIMGQYEKRGPVVLNIQRQLVNEGRQLNDTDAGMAIKQNIDRNVMNLRQDLDEMKRELRSATGVDIDEAQGLQKALAKALETLEFLIQSREKLLADFAELARQEVPAYARVLKDIQDDARSPLVTPANKSNAADRSFGWDLDQDKYRMSQQDSTERPLSWRSTETASPGRKQTSQDLEGRSRINRNNKERINGNSGESEDTVIINDSDDVDSDSEFESSKSNYNNHTGAKRPSKEKGKKRKMLRRNLIPILEILTGIGIAASGAAQPVMIAPGITAILSGISSLDFSKEGGKATKGAQRINTYGDSFDA